LTPAAKVSYPFRNLKAVYDLFRDEGSLASSQIPASLGIHQNTALKRLKRLIQMNIVQKKGRGADVRYEVRM